MINIGESARNDGTSPATSGFRLEASASSAQVSVPPFFGVSLVDVVALPQAAASTAIAANTVDTRNHRDLPIDRSMYVNYLLSFQAKMGRERISSPNRRNHASTDVNSSRKSPKY